ncbi:hypothetical protein JXB02_05380 [Candidatus Woesearchaeota archaeon]|nr:hypothetical protein [Candidatus Woesearchaeota archaeon]
MFISDRERTRKVRQFAKTLLRVYRTRTERDDARTAVSGQLDRIKRLAFRKTTRRATLEREIVILERQIERLVGKERELAKTQHANLETIRLLKHQVKELQQRLGVKTEESPAKTAPKRQPADAIRPRRTPGREREIEALERDLKGLSAQYATIRRTKGATRELLDKAKGRIDSYRTRIAALKRQHAPAAKRKEKGSEKKAGSHIRKKK